MRVVCGVEGKAPRSLARAKARGHIHGKRVCSAALTGARFCRLHGGEPVCHDAVAQRHDGAAPPAAGALACGNCREVQTARLPLVLAPGHELGRVEISS